MTLNQWAEGIRVSVRHTPGEHYSSSAENLQVALDQRWAGLLVATSARDPLSFSITISWSMRPHAYFLNSNMATEQKKKNPLNFSVTLELSIDSPIILSIQVTYSQREKLPALSRFICHIFCIVAVDDGSLQL